MTPSRRLTEQEKKLWKDNLTPHEEEAAASICKLAEGLENLLYYQDGADLSSKCKNILETAYRALKRATDFFYGADSPLSYEGRVRGTPFAKKPTTTEGK